MIVHSLEQYFKLKVAFDYCLLFISGSPLTIYQITMKKFAIIVAGGSGIRMNNIIPKQFLLLNDKPVLYYTINTFFKAFDDMQIILVLPEEYMNTGLGIIDEFFNYNRIQVTNGGRTRFHSVQSGLQFVNEESIVFVHDAVRCLVSVNLVRRCFDALQPCWQRRRTLCPTCAENSWRNIL